MIRSGSLAFAAAALTFQVTVAQTPAPIPIGAWRNPQPSNDDIVRVRVDRTAERTTAHVWVQCGQVECDWGEQTLMPAARSDASAGASGIWRQGTTARYLTFKPQGDRLEVSVRLSPDTSIPARSLTLEPVGQPPGAPRTASPTAGILRVGGTIPEPEKLKHVPAVYPPDAIAAGIQGMVIVEIVIGTKGTVEETRVLRSVPGLDYAAVAAMRQWEYTPTIVNGEAVRVAWTVTQNFVLPPREPAVADPPSTPAASVPQTPTAEAPPPVRIGGAIPTPTKLTNVNPIYPPEAQRKRIQGVVGLEVIIGTDGHVENIKVIRSVAGLDDAAIDAVKQWTYTPTVVNGVAQRVIYTVSVSFSLQSGGGRGASTGIPPGTRAVRVGAGVPAPQRIKGSDPKYPGSAKSKGIEGTVVLELIIMPDGRVMNARVVKSIKELDKAALDAAKNWEYTPTLVGGARVTVVYQVDVPFKIDR